MKIYGAGAVLDFMSRKQSKKPYTINAKDKVGEIFLYDVVGDSWDGTTGKTFAADLKKIGNVDELRIFINSPGGSVFDGTAIFNQIRRHRAHKIVNIDGIAASIASVVAMAGDEINIAANGMMMIHNPWSFAIGSADDMRKTAETLDRIRDTILGTYVARTGGQEDHISEMMTDETWMTAEEAVDMGFADSIVGEVEVAALAKFDLSDFKHVPEKLVEVRKNAPAEPAEPSDPDAGGEPVAAKPHPAIAKANARLLKRKLKQGRPCAPSLPPAA